MAKIARYEAQVPLDTDRGGMPHPRFDNSLGAALESVGSAVSKFAAQTQARNEQRENTNTEIEWRKYQQALASGLDEQRQGIAADGAGFHDGFLEQVYRPAREKFLSTVPARLRPHYDKLLESGGLDETDWSTKAAVTERDQMYNWARDEVKVTNDQLAKAVNLDPDAYDSLLEQGNGFIDNTPLPDAEKVQLRREWERIAQLAHLDRMLESGNSTQVLSALGADVNSLPPSSQFAVISQVVEQIESSGNPNAVSGAGAAGRMQVMPGTAREIAAKIRDPNFRADMTDDEVRRYMAVPDVGKRYGEFYLREQLAKYGPSGGVKAALVAYNAGPQVAEKWIASGFDNAVLPKETRGYLAKFAAQLPGMAGETRGLANADNVKVVFAGNAKARVLRDGRSTEDVQPEVLSRAKTAFAALGIGEIKVTSGYRDEAENRRVKGARESQHKHGTALDIDVTGYSVAERVRIIGALSASGFGGIGVGSNIIHADLGPRRAWGYGAGPHGGSAPPPWAQKAIAEHMAGRATIARGGSISDRYATLPYDQRQAYINRAAKGAQDAYAAQAQATVSQRFEVQQAMDAELASLSATGVSTGNADPTRVASTLGEEKLLRFLADREDALGSYAARSGIAQMDDEAMDTRLEEYRPDPGSADFQRQQKMFATVEKEIDRVRATRAKAPAKAALDYPDVASAYKAFKDDPGKETATEYIRLNLQRQREFGVAPTALRPLPTAEALQIGRALSRVPESRKIEDTRAAIVVQYLALQEIFGDYTEEVIISALAEYKGVSKNTAELITGYMQAIELGGDPLKLRNKAEAATEADQTEGAGFFGGLLDFFRGGPSEGEATGLSPEARLRLSDVLENATPEDEAQLVRLYGQAAVDAAKKAGQEQ